MCFFPGTHSFGLFFPRSHILDVGPSPTSMKWENILYFPGGKEEAFSEKKKSNFSHLCYISFFRGFFWVIFYFYFLQSYFLFPRNSSLLFAPFYNRIIFFLNKKICQVQPTPVKPYGAPANYSLVSKKMNTCFCITLSSKEVCYCHSNN